MSALPNALPPARVCLDFQAMSQPDAVHAVLSLFEGDPAVSDQDAFTKAVAARPAPLIVEGQCGIVIAHGRTDAVQKLALAAGRFAPPLDTSTPLRLVFVAGIPTTMNAQYLRTIGAIARVCNNPELLTELLLAATPQHFIDTLAQSQRM